MPVFNIEYLGIFKKYDKYERFRESKWSILLLKNLQSLLQVHA